MGIKTPSWVPRLRSGEAAFELEAPTSKVSNPINAILEAGFRMDFLLRLQVANVITLEERKGRSVAVRPAAKRSMWCVCPATSAPGTKRTKAQPRTKSAIGLTADIRLCPSYEDVNSKGIEFGIGGCEPPQPPMTAVGINRRGGPQSKSAFGGGAVIPEAPMRRPILTQNGHSARGELPRS